MMSGASQALVLRFNADTAPARKAFTELAQTGASQMALLAGAAAASGRKIDGGMLGTLAKLAAGITGVQLAYAGFAAVAASSIAIAIERLGEYRRILAEANAVGVSTDFYQKFVQSADAAVEKAKLLGAALQTARGATREGLEGSSVGNRIDEFWRNGGFTEAGEAARTAYRNAADAETRIQAALLAIDSLREAGRALEGLDLAEKLFGQAAADALIARADRAGMSLSAMVNATADKRVVSPEQIENARQLEERLEAARKTMAEGMRPILEDLERLGVALYRGWVNTEEAIAAVVSKVGALYSALKQVVTLLPGGTENIAGAVTATAEARLASLDAQIKSIERGGVFDPRLKGLQAQRDELRAVSNAARGRQQLADDAVPFIPMGSGPVQLGPSDPLAQPSARPPRRPITDQPLPVSRSGGASPTDTDLAFYEKYVANIEKATAALKAEQETLGQSVYARERAVLTAKADAEFKAKDIELSDEQRAKLEQMIEAQARMKDSLERSREAMQGQRELVNFLGTSMSGFFSDVISGGKNASDALMNLTKRLADAAIQAALLGQGPLASLFGMQGQNGAPGGLFGALFGGFGGGGGGLFSSLLPAPGAVFDVGSRNVPNDMIARVHQGEMIIPRGAADRIRQGEGLGSGGASRLEVALSPDLVAQILEQARGQSVSITRQGIAANNRALPGMLEEQRAR